MYRIRKKENINEDYIPVRDLVNLALDRIKGFGYQSCKKPMSGEDFEQ